jgi:REP element-mobilizing transposase RayT
VCVRKARPPVGAATSSSPTIFAGAAALIPALRTPERLSLFFVMDHLHFFDPRGELGLMQNRLPHWQQSGGVYFVTFRLADSLPVEFVRRWRSERRQWLRCNPPPLTEAREREFHRLFSLEMERRLDAGHGSCVLREPAAAKTIVEALHFHEGRRSEMISFAVMPNHIHLLFGLVGGTPIDALIRNWKSFTSHALAKQRGPGWPGWQKDYFDRLIRDADHFARCVRYIRRNPEKARLRAGEYVVWENEWAKTVV